jgi:hypothetical protein
VRAKRETQLALSIPCTMQLHTQFKRFPPAQRGVQSCQVLRLRHVDSVRHQKRGTASERRVARDLSMFNRAGTIIQPAAEAALHAGREFVELRTG